MDDLKSVTVSHLRELAQKHLGGGYSKLKKEELIAALAAHIPALAKLARLAGITVARKSSTEKKVAAKEPKTERPKPAASKSPGRSAASKVREEKPREPKATKPAAREPKKALKAKVSSKAKPAQQSPESPVTGP